MTHWITDEKIFEWPLVVRIRLTDTQAVILDIRVFIQQQDRVRGQRRLDTADALVTLATFVLPKRPLVRMMLEPVKSTANSPF